jgi:hypothetical protein
MLTNIFKLTLDPLLTQDMIKPKQNEQNKYNLIYSDYHNINKRGSYNRENLYPFPQFN